MIDFQYLHTGVYGLANAHNAGTMAGHLGAAIAAGYFFGEDQSDLPDELFRGIEGEIKRVIAGEESFWWNAKNAGITPADLFMPLPKEDSKPDAITAIVDALQRNVGAGTVPAPSYATTSVARTRWRASAATGPTR